MSKKNCHNACCMRCDRSLLARIINLLQIIYYWCSSNTRTHTQNHSPCAFGCVGLDLRSGWQYLWVAALATSRTKFEKMWILPRVSIFWFIKSLVVGFIDAIVDERRMCNFDECANEKPLTAHRHYATLYIAPINKAIPIELRPPDVGAVTLEIISTNS